MKQPQHQPNEEFPIVSLPQNQPNEPDLTDFVVVPNQTLVSASMIAAASTVSTTKDETPHWVKFNGFRMPNGAIIGGYTGHENLYIGRALNNEALTPGTRLHDLKYLFNSINFKELSYPQEILCIWPGVFILTLKQNSKYLLERNIIG